MKTTDRRAHNCRPGYRPLALVLGVLLLGRSALLPAAVPQPSPAAVSQSTTLLTPVADTTIDATLPGEPQGNDPTIRLFYGGQNETGHALIRFNLAAALPPEAIIDAATLRLHLSAGDGPDPLTLTASNLLADWAESTVTWSTAPPAGDPTTLSSISTTPGLQTLDVTDIVRAWHNVPHYGLQLAGPETGDNYNLTFESREPGINPPRLEVIYHLPTLPAYTFSGHVYHGEPPEPGAPLSGATIQLFGAEGSQPFVGPSPFLASTTTGPDGAFTLRWQGEPFPNYHLVQTAPPGFYPIASAPGEPGVSTAAHTITYAEILSGTYDAITFWNQPLPGGCQEWLANGDLERGEFTPWGTMPNIVLGTGRESDWGAQFGGEDNYQSEIWQPVALPTGAERILLTFWWLADTPENQPGDALKLHIQYGDEQSDLLAIMPATDPLGLWRYGVADLTAYAGRQVSITFLAETDPEIPTTFRLDDISLIACGAALSDLVVSGIDWEPGVGICYLIENNGEGIAPAGHQTALWIDGVPVAEQWVDAILAPGQPYGHCFDYAWACSHPDDQVAVSADVGDHLAESIEDNNRLEQTWSCDTAAPQILTGPVVAERTATSALILWETDQPATSLVHYGRTASDFDETAVDPSLVQDHAVTLYGLQPSTPYRFVVESASASGSIVRSGELTFQTLALPDAQDPEITLDAPEQWRGTVRIAAAAADNRGVEKVAFCLTAEPAGAAPREDEFCLDGELLLTDYAPPYELDLDTTRYDNGAYTLTARAYDLSARSATTDPLRVDLANLVDQASPQVTITAPGEGNTVTGKTTITASVTDDRALGDVVFRVDGTQIGFQTNPPNTQSATAQFTWDSTQVGNDNHLIEVKAYDLQGRTGQDSVNVNVYNAPPPPQPYLIITGHTATRSGHYLTINLTVKNVGASAASNIYLQDYMQAFQPLSKTSASPGGTAYRARYSPTNTAADCGITDPNPLAAGASRTYTYETVPILTYPNPPPPALGTSTGVWYEGTGSVKHYHDYKIKIVATTAFESIATAYDNALKQATFLILTNPGEMFAHYMWYDVDDLLSAMAELARHKSGVLGYLGTKNRDTIDSLIEPSGAWAKALSPSFSQLYGGALLIVGETEIVPAWEQGGFSIGWNPVKYSDQPYADIGGSPAPELLVGRIVGDSPNVMIKPIQASIGVYTNAPGYAFEQDGATLISGPGFGTFVQDIETAATILHNQGFQVAPVHTKDYFRVSSFPRAYQTSDALASGDVDPLNPNDEIAIADNTADRIYIYAGNGTLLHDFPVGYGGSAFDAGDRIAIAGANVVMADASANRILLYDASGNPQGSFALDFEPFDALAVGDVTGDSQPEIVIADQSADKVLFYTTTGTKLGPEIAQPFDQYDLVAVGDILGDTKDEIVLTDRSANKLLLFNASGTLLGSRQFNTVTLPGKTMTWLEYLDYDTSLQADLGGSALAVGNLYPWPSGNDSGKQEILLAPGQHYYHINVYWWNAAGGELVETGPIPWEFDGFEGLATGEIGTYGGRVQDEVFVADLSGHLRILDTNNWLGRFHAALPTYTPNADLLYLSGHGNVDGCCGLSSYRDAIWPLNFNQHNPVVLATSCLTGNYQDGLDNKNFADTMLKGGAAAYIGSTQSSHGGEDRIAAQWLFSNWDLGESIGRVFTELERQYWKGSQADNWWFWAYEYNLYGDPTFSTAPATQSQQLSDPPLPNPILEIDIPHFTITTTQGLDLVEIPGGRLPTGPGEPWLPYYVTTLQVPPGTRVRDVTLLERSAPSTGTGLILPMTPYTPTACACTLEPYAAPEPGWLPEQVFTWDVIDDVGGASTLVVTTYPFYYNPQTTAFEFYQHYTFEIDTATTSLALTGLSTGQSQYQPGEPVDILLTLENSGEPQDAILSTLIRRSGSQGIVAGLPLESLDSLQGHASFSFSWDSSGLQPGYYDVEVTLRDSGGTFLATESQRFRLGTVSGEIVELDATPTHFQVGDPIDVSLIFRNTGTIPLDGVARIQILDGTGVLAAEFTHDIASLPAGHAVTLLDTWDTTGFSDGTYRVIAYITYDSTATTPAAVQVSTHHFIHLPLLLRNTGE